MTVLVLCFVLYVLAFQAFVRAGAVFWPVLGVFAGFAASFTVLFEKMGWWAVLYCYFIYWGALALQWKPVVRRGAALIERFAR